MRTVMRGTLTQMPRPYELAPYSPEWSTEFANEAVRLRALLGETLREVHHIGSTSVPGLAAKPVIDLLPVVSDVDTLDARTDVLVRAGYEPWGEYGLPGRRYFTKAREGRRTHHLHCYGAGDPEIERHVAFAAYLRAHDEMRAEYEALKREGFARHPGDIEAYCDFKDPWIKAAEQRAIAWSRAITREPLKGPGRPSGT